MVGLIIAAGIGGVILFVCAIWIIVIAFRESTSCGLLVMLVPFYGLYYAITRWAETKKPFLISLIGVVLVVGGIVPTLVQFKAEAEPVMMEFMEAASLKDVDRAYACWSSQAITKEELADLINSNYDFFVGYKGLSTSSWSVESSAGVTTGYISGAIEYFGDTRLPFEAWLVKEHGVWKLTGIYIGY